MNIKLPIKFTDREIDQFTNTVFTNHQKFPKANYIFDFTDVEYIGNQELLVLSALFKSFYTSNIDFEILFFKQGIVPRQIGDRVKRQIIQFWEVWQIWRTIGNNDFKKYFGIESSSSIENLKSELKYYPKLSEIYTRHGVTPFVSLDYINNYNEIDVQNIIHPIYKLNRVIETLLKASKCSHPFTSNSLSTIITEELFLNFLDHSGESSFFGFQKHAFMSISFQEKIDEDKYTPLEIQKRKELNFKTECLEESINFFYDKKAKKYKNNPYIQFSFLDFGQGIVQTLREQYDKQNSIHSLSKNDSDVLLYAFKHDSSRHPIFDTDYSVNKSIPRGLFDALSIVRRYNGLLIVRSNYGKILFDFSISNDVEKALRFFGDGNMYFPGTLISLYLPAIDNSSEINISAIKPEIIFSKIKPNNKKYVNIKFIVNNLPLEKEQLYNALLIKLKNEICNNKDHSLAVISFRGSEQIEKRIIKKILYFLLSDYDINSNNNVIVINPPSQDILNEIFSEINYLSDAIKNYKLHPLPLVCYTAETDEIKIEWLGVYNEFDKNKLNDLLLEGYTITKTDLNDPSNVLGQLNTFDSHGNLFSNLPNRAEIIDFYKDEGDIVDSLEIERLLLKHNCIKKEVTGYLYLCNGNYYQREYVELNNLINDKNDCSIVTQLLFDKIAKNVKTIRDYKFIGITTTSQKLIKSLEFQGFIDYDNYITLKNYHTIEKELENEIINLGDKFILICDVTSTGFLTKRLQDRLEKRGAKIEYIAVIVSILEDSFETTKTILKDYENKIISLHRYPIKKFKREDINEGILENEIIRINPHTNIPITLKIRETNYDKSIIFPTKINYDKARNEILITNKFLETITPETIKIGFLKFNNAIHPYFFDTSLFLNCISEGLLRDIFGKIGNGNLQHDNVQIFYPKESGIERFQFEKIKNSLNNHSIEVIEVERFCTPEGWRFPHNTNYLSSKIENNLCFILDDGSCSGDSLIQIIDEISFQSAKEIILLCFIGRVNDHKRELFSRLSMIKVKGGVSIPISIYFASHWHIPTYYLDENPNIKETSWISEIINIQNTPPSIKRIANTIKDVIQPKLKDEFEDYKYLPKDRLSGKIPKKELILIREEVGKVVGYRLYKESFKFFDFFIKKYETKKYSNDRYKEIELLCATFIFEPYLYSKIAGILPDVVSKIEDFTRALIFGNSSIKKQTLNLDTDLFYLWRRKDIIHLFFVVFTDEKLIIELTGEKFIQLVKFTEPTESNLDYILYKLLYYFPLNKNEITEKRYTSKILTLLNSTITSGTLLNVNHIKKFKSFLLTLPSNEDFNHSLLVINLEYDKILNEQFHNSNVVSYLDTISVQLAYLQNQYELDVVKEIEENWCRASDTMEKILSFRRKFPDFFTSLPKDDLRFIDNYRAVHGEASSMIYSLNENTNYNDLDSKILNQIGSIFQRSNCIFKMFENIETNIEKSLIVLILAIENKYINSKVTHNIIAKNTIVLVPNYIFYDILLCEILENFRHCDFSQLINFEITYISPFVTRLSISNHCNESNLLKGNGIGTDRIKCLDKFPGTRISYRSEKDVMTYIQTIEIETK